MPSTRLTLLAFAACAAALTGACGDGDKLPLTRDASAVEAFDASAEADDEPDDAARPDATHVQLPPGRDAGRPDQDADAAQLDASDMDGAEPDGGEIDGAEPEAGETDADGGDAAGDAEAADAADATPCPEGQTADACGVCAGDGTSCAQHPLTGQYAARSVIYMRQKVDLSGDVADLTSKAILFSVADINAQGELREHHCFVEIVNDIGISSWIPPAAVQAIPDAVAALTLQDGHYVRTAAADHTYVSWSPAAQPTDCVAGQPHSSGCQCYAPDQLPYKPDDCRLSDLDGDHKPGARMLIAGNRPADPAAADAIAGALLELEIAGTKSVGWQLPSSAANSLVGSIEGGMDQAELSRSSGLGDQLGRIDNSICPGSYGHVELVRGKFDCAAVLADRAAGLQDSAGGDGIFDLTLDGTAPDPSVCPDPALTCTGVRDACGKCNGPGMPAGKCDCAGTSPDACGVCGGDGKSCAGCDGIANSGKKLDACGVCGGDGKSCAGCDGIANSGKKLDACGVCGGNGIPSGKCDCQGHTNDACGVCGGSGSTCAGCDGAANSGKKNDSCGVCGGPGIPAGKCDCQGHVKDACGTCNGPGIPAGACDCTGKLPTLWYDDTDGDQQGNPAVSVQACAQPAGFVANHGDADPGCAGARDACNVCKGSGIPAGKCDCQGHVKDACGTCNGPGIPAGACDCTGKAPSIWYDDADGDQSGNPAVSVQACTQPTGFVANHDDADPTCGGARDACNVCHGDGKSCAGCDGVPNSGKKKDSCGVCGGNGPDACGVCGGNGSGCAGCDGVPNSGKTKDVCGVCGGNGSSCAGCDGVPNSGKKNDACGVCGGNGSSCAGCDGVANSGKKLDACGVCAGNGSSCAGCDGVANSGKKNDACGVCGGNGSSCAGCDGVPNSGKKLDACGVCAGNGSTCAGCDGVANSGKKPDACGVCGGSGIPAGKCDCQSHTNDACGVCGGPGIPAGKCDCQGHTNDACGVCGGPGIPAGKCDCQGHSNDVCGVCGGNGTSCLGCDGVANSGKKLDACGVCGGSATGTCTSSLIGTYAVRVASYGKQRNGTEVVSSKSLAYSLINVTKNSDGSLKLTENGCWTQTLPNPNESGTKVYSWSKPAWVQAMPASVQNLTSNGNGSYTRAIPLTRFGWDPARQPASCNSGATPVQPWPSGWGSTCTCNTPASSLPPYDHDASPYDCRLVDADKDGQPGMSAIASTSAPSAPDANAPLIGGTAYAAVDASATWVITPASDGHHTATVDDRTVAQVVGCSGLACGSLASTPPGSASCPAALNRAQFVPVTDSSNSCSEIIAARDSLFVQNQDPAWPDNSACPPP